MIENSQRVKIAEGQVAALRNDIAKSNLTDKELTSLPPGTNTYQSVGRMYAHALIHLHADTFHFVTWQFYWVSIAESLPPPPTSPHTHRFILQPLKKVRADLKHTRAGKEDKIKAIQKQVSEVIYS